MTDKKYIQHSKWYVLWIPFEIVGIAIKNWGSEVVDMFVKAYRAIKDTK